MSSDNIDFTITFGDSKCGAPFHRTGSVGVADSVEAVQKAGLPQAPPYLFAQGRAVADKSDPIWSTWNDTLAERWTVNAKKNYSGLKKGKHVIDIVGGGLFMPRPDAIREVIRADKLVNHAFPLSNDNKEMLLGDMSVYVFRDSASGFELKGPKDWVCFLPHGRVENNYALDTIRRMGLR